MSDMFASVSNKYKNSPSVVIIFVVSVLMLLIGLNHFVEDTYSSYLGLKNLETAFGLNVQIFNWSYWTMSLAPQIASIIFFYIYLSDTEEGGWALWASLASQLIDFFADVWYRSDGMLFSNPKASIISILLTFGYFTIGSEVFVTIGSGLILKLYVPALQNWKTLISDVKKVKKQFKSGNISMDSDRFKSSQKSTYKPLHKPAHMLPNQEEMDAIHRKVEKFQNQRNQNGDKLQRPPWG